MKPFLLRWNSFAESWGIKTWMLAALFCGVLVPIMVFGAIADEVHEGDDFRYDTLILQALHLRATPELDAVMKFVTCLARAWVLVPFCAVVVAYLLWRKLNGQAFFFTVANLGAGLFNLIAKMFFGRDRPSLWESIAPENDYSFPSGHAMASMAVTAAFVLMLWPTRFRWFAVIIGVVYVLAIALTRLYLGVHYPTDILGGWCASMAWVGGVYTIITARRQWKTRAQQQKVALNS